MMDFIKMAVLGAALSYAAVSAYEQPMQKLEAALAGAVQDRTQQDDEVQATGALSSRRRSGTLHVVAIATPEASDLAPETLTVDR